MNKAVDEMRQALQAIYLELPEPVAADVNAKVWAFIKEWQAHLTRAHGGILCDFPYQIEPPEGV